jgi:hypothetical protein
MSDAINDDDKDDLDRAFRAALATATLAEDSQDRQRRRQAVLGAVAAALATAPTLPLASNEPQWRRMPSGWRGAAAASVLVCSALIVGRLVDEPAPPVPAPAVDLVAPVPAPAIAAATRRAPAMPAPHEPDVRHRPDAAGAPNSSPPLLDQAAAPSPLAATPVTMATADRSADAAPPTAGSEGLATGRQLASPVRAGETASTPGLLAAVAQGNANAARRLLTARGPDNERDADGRSALMLAVLRSDAVMATLLLQHGADRLATDHSGQTAQAYAVASGNPAMLRAFGLAP